jgi:hypothetical protein
MLPRFDVALLSAAGHHQEDPYPGCELQRIQQRAGEKASTDAGEQQRHHQQQLCAK